MTPVHDVQPPIGTQVAEDPAVRAVFSGRVAPIAVPAPTAAPDANLSLVVGAGDVASARRDALALIGATPESAVFMEQVHGGEVAVVGSADAGRGVCDHADAIPGVDALVTFECDVALAVLVADCVPVLLVDPGRGIAAVHAGRRGVQANVVATAVRTLADADSSGVVALVGPTIGGCCYEVAHALHDEVAAEWPQAAARTTWGSPSLDLRAAVAAQLAAAGVAGVEHLGGCTRCAPAAWFSHRATTGGGAGAAGWAAGRQAGLVVRRAAAGPARSAAAASLD